MQTPQGVLKRLADRVFFQPPLKGLFLCFLVPAARKRVYALLKAQSVRKLIFVRLMFYCPFTAIFGKPLPPRCLGVRVSGGHLCKAEAPTEAACTKNSLPGVWGCGCPVDTSAKQKHRPRRQPRRWRAPKIASPV